MQNRRCTASVTTPIEGELVVAQATVKTHLVYIYDLLDVDNRAAAVASEAMYRRTDRRCACGPGAV